MPNIENTLYFEEKNHALEFWWYSWYVVTEVTNQLVGVERILEYCQLESEKQPNTPTKVPRDWPSQGKIEFKNVSYRYSVDGKATLHGLTFSINPKEKIGVVGRTGAGKSSLISSIFRLALVDGDIIVDDINTSHVQLNTLRSRISIIPQETILFSGSLRRYVINSAKM